MLCNCYVPNSKLSAGDIGMEVEQDVDEELSFTAAWERIR